jgi:uncharacterized protein YecT (DUF1311 family)
MQPASRTSAFRRSTALVVTAFCLHQAPLFAQSDQDQALNTTYQAVLAKLTPAGREQLRKVERAWLVFIEFDRGAMRAAAARLHLSAADEQDFERKGINARISQLEELTDLTAGPEVAPVFRQNDEQLNVVYQRCITSMTPAEVDALRKAQRAWLVFREESRKFGGVVGARITAARTEQLNAFYIQSTAQAPAPPRVVESMARPEADRTTPDPFERAR